MKLFYSPGACSLSPHIVLREAGYDFTIEKVDLKAKKTESGADFMAINDKGYIPALQLDNGELVTEGVAIVQYLADNKPESGLAPKPGTMERVRLNEWLTYIATELHKGFSPLFHKVNDEAYAAGKTKLLTRLEYVAKAIKGPFLTGDKFTVADAYLFTILNWAGYHDIDLKQWPTLAAFSARVSQRPSVQAALQAEGLLKAAA